jgi:phthalate 3,4-dioxygenase ferredoxin reductase component
MTERVIVLGASLSGIRTAEALRALGFRDELIVVGAEPHQPYDRPGLSKQYLQDPDASHSDLALIDAEAAASLGIQLRLGVAAEHLDCANRAVLLDDGTRLAFDHCVVATGAHARSGPWKLGETTLTLRTIDDATTLRSKLSPGTRIAVIGAGFIGAEVGSSARSAGCEVTVIDPMPVPMCRALGAQVGAEFVELLTHNGVTLRLGKAVESIHELATSSRVMLTGGEHVDADIVVVGVGAAPADNWLESSDLQVSDGLICDRYCRAAGSRDVYAVGDVARWHHPGYDELVRLEHWTNAIQQAQVVAHNIVHPDRLVEYRPIEYVWSEQHGAKLQFAGRFSRVEAFDVIGNADFTSPRPCAAIVCSDADANLIACATINWPRASAQARRLLAQGCRYTAARDSLRQLRLKTAVSQHE